MLLSIVLHQPQLLIAIVRGTPTWVWGLLAALVGFGASQLRDRTASLARISTLPVAMAAFSAFGMVSAFGAAPNMDELLAVWLGVAAAVTAALAPGRAAAVYDARRREYRLPGSVVPLLLMAGIFLVKWSVGVELALQPQVVRDASFTLPVAALYGLATGLFVGRAARLWRLAVRRPAVAPASA
ncbi:MULTISPECIES: DUF6622 family protein [Ramlibacter]|uniref:DUF1453 domain-containing protein n=1 Tax=Ramlibacter pinisoli TaxID=2682844 RepID=A0A6N8IQS2_9BURK|nr:MULTISPECIES: DUF6622 family protein [Ramlibacter]MBA2963655.1 hypothetical protein [Ramlibacter sp. CGMCC 1.13660]MVQ28620.1 hypothetical protein [Ramlibacter pinisoli]